MKVFHILNGESTANGFRQTPIVGDHLVWREDLMTGCVRQSGSPDQDGWLALRSTQLATTFDIEKASCRAELERQEQRLYDSLSAGEIVFWFEHDLFCQINLVYLLDWYQRHSNGNVSLTIPPPTDRVEQGLGTLQPTDLLDIFSNRVEVTQGALDLAGKVWEAYASPSALQLVHFLETGNSQLPFLGRAIESHLSRFPSIKNGLGKVENVALNLITGGKTRFAILFPAFVAEHGEYGYGDLHFFLALRRLVECPKPLLEVNVSLNAALQDGELGKVSFELTATGVDVLDGHADHVELNGIDQWLGGVHLTDDSQQRWDEHRRLIV